MCMNGKGIILFLLNYGVHTFINASTLKLHAGSDKYSNRLLPDWVPFHPHRWWIHVRTVYVPMCYLYGIKFKAEENDLIRALREVM